MQTPRLKIAALRQSLPAVEAFSRRATTLTNARAFNVAADKDDVAAEPPGEKKPVAWQVATMQLLDEPSTDAKAFVRVPTGDTSRHYQGPLGWEPFASTDHCRFVWVRRPVYADEYRRQQAKLAQETAAKAEAEVKPARKRSWLWGREA